MKKCNSNVAEALPWEIEDTEWVGGIMRLIIRHKTSNCYISCYGKFKKLPDQSDVDVSYFSDLQQFYICFEPWDLISKRAESGRKWLHQVWDPAWVQGYRPDERMNLPK
jgi:hypothetical protein